MQNTITALGRNILITGHYGSGKTNLAINIALMLANSGVQTALCDLDIVNPYFRSADFATLANAHNIELCAPVFAGTNLDTPALSSRVDALITQQQKTLILDIGGDAQGAIALGRYSTRLKEEGYSMLYVINERRLSTATPAEAVEILREIEAASHMQATHLVNNTHLCTETTPQIITQSQPYAHEVSRLTGKPIAFTAVPQNLAPQMTHIANLLPVHIYVQAPWQKED